MPDNIISSTSSDGPITYAISNAAKITQGTLSINPYDVIVADGDVINQVIASGTTISINQQGVATGNTVQSDGALYITSTTGNNVSNVIEGGGTITADTAPMISTTIESGGILNLSYTYAKDTTMNSGAIMNLYSNASITSQAFDNGEINIYNGGSIADASFTSNVVVNVYSGGSISKVNSTSYSIYITNGANVNIFEGGSIDIATVTTSAVLNLYNNANASIVYASNGGTINLHGSNNTAYCFTRDGGIVNVSGGSFAGVVDGGTLNLNNFSYDGSTTSDRTYAFVRMAESGTVNVGNGVDVEFHYYEGGIVNVSSGGHVTSLIFTGYTNPDNAIYVYSGGTIDDAQLYTTDIMVLSGASVNSLEMAKDGLATLDGSINSLTLGIVGTVMDGGSAVINSGGVVNSLTANNNASALFNAGASLTGTLTLNDGGKVTITTSTGGIVDLVGDTNAGLTIYGSAAAGQNISVTTVINDFSGAGEGNSDSITLADIRQNDIASINFPDNDHITLTLKDNSSITLNIPNIKTTGYSLGTNDSNNGLTLQVCFLMGTLIEIPGGACAVEALEIGDSVLVYDPVSRQKISVPVTWIGHKKTSVKSHVHPDEAGYAVRILKNAIAENVPNKDLLITSEHCLYFDGKFIPARMLVNGYSIYYDTAMTSYDYYHIETEKHSILTADGMLTESYLDTGNRHIFNQDQKIIKLSGNKIKSWQEDAIVTLAIERSFVETVYNNILQRAHARGCLQQGQAFETTQDPDVYLITDQGEVIYKKMSSTDRKASFVIPNTANAVWIMSRTSRPCDVIGPFIDDRRYLGVLIGDITLEEKGKKRAITAHAEEDYLLGWDIKEAIPCRWTKGKAFLPLHVQNYSNIPTILTLTILSDHSYLLDKIMDSKKLA